MPRRRLGSLVAVGCWLSFQAANAFIPSTRPVSISLLSRPAERCRRSIPLYASVEDKTFAAGGKARRVVSGQSGLCWRPMMGCVLRDGMIPFPQKRNLCWTRTARRPCSTSSAV